MLGVTASAIVVRNLFEGVLVGLALAVVKTAWDISQVHVEIEDRGEMGVVVRVVGNATFLRLPKLLDALDGVPRERGVRLDLGGLWHVDHACATALEAWRAGVAVERGADAKGPVQDGLMQRGLVQGRMASSRSTS